jgi:hypothetical protein
MGAAAVIGMLLDSARIWSGLVAFAAPLPFAWLAPDWILVLCLAFALPLNHSMAALQGRPRIAAALGPVGGPLVNYITVHAWQAAGLVASSVAGLPCAGTCMGDGYAGLAGLGVTLGANRASAIEFTVPDMSSLAAFFLIALNKKAPRMRGFLFS